MSDRIVVMDRGRIAQIGTPSDLHERPATPFIANYIGDANLIRGTVAPGHFSAPGLSLPMMGPDGPAILSIRPERITLAPRRPDCLVTACLSAMRNLDDIKAWSARAETEMSPLSGKTPPALRAVLTEWPLVSAPMAEALTGASRAAVQRNLAWMEARGLIREVTGQGRYRMWRATN